jgi:hypothetical protein
LRFKAVIARVPLAIVSGKQLHHAKRLIVSQRPGDIVGKVGLLEQAHIEFGVVNADNAPP